MDKLIEKLLCGWMNKKNYGWINRNSMDIWMNGWMGG